MELTFLGTSCMVPTKERNVSGVYLSYKGEGILLDCGEGTQRQMNIAGINRNSVRKVLISHWHADHMAGLLGLLQTMGNMDDEATVDIFGPKDTTMRMEHLLKCSAFDLRIRLNIHELTPKGVEVAVNENEYTILVAPMSHSTPCVGFAFIEKDRRRVDMKYLKSLGVPEGPHLQALQLGKSITHKGKQVDVEKATQIVRGKKIAWIPDTRPCQAIVDLGQDADLMIIEATYASSLPHKAEQYSHMTAKESALLGNQANVKKLVLTHFSQRYDTTQEIEEDARTYFSDAVCAHDFMKIKL